MILLALGGALIALIAAIGATIVMVAIGASVILGSGEQLLKRLKIK